MKKLWFSLVGLFILSTGLTQSLTIKSTLSGQQFRYVHPIATLQLGSFEERQVKKNKIGLRISMGVGASLETATQVTITSLRSRNGSRSSLVNLAFRFRYFPGKNLFPFTLTNYTSLAMIGTWYRKGRSIMSYYLMVKSARRNLSFLGGTIHKISKNLALTLDAAMKRVPPTTIQEEGKIHHPGFRFSMGVGFIYYFDL